MVVEVPVVAVVAVVVVVVMLANWLVSCVMVCCVGAFWVVADCTVATFCDGLVGTCSVMAFFPFVVLLIVGRAVVSLTGLFLIC